MPHAPSMSVGSFYESVPLEMHGHRKKLEFFIHALRRLESERRLKPADIRVLEIGCSNGRNVTLPLAELGYEITGLDIHEPSIEAANAANHMSNARFMCTDLTAYTTDKPHNVLILSDVLEHVHEPGQMISTAMKHLSPDGIVLISIPNGYGPFEIERFLFDLGVLKPVFLMRDCVRWIKRHVCRARPQPAPALPAYNWESGHVQFFTDRSFRRVLGAAGLRVRRKANGCLFGGEVTSYLHAYWPGLTKRSLQMADYLPGPLVSTWYFECDLASSEGGLPGIRLTPSFMKDKHVV